MTDREVSPASGVDRILQDCARVVQFHSDIRGSVKTQSDLQGVGGEERGIMMRDGQGPVSFGTQRGALSPADLGAPSFVDSIDAASPSGMDRGKIPLAAVLANLRSAIEDARRADGMFLLQSLDLELHVALKESDQDASGLSWFVQFGRQSAAESEISHRLTLRLALREELRGGFMGEST